MTKLRQLSRLAVAILFLVPCPGYSAEPDTQGVFFENIMSLCGTRFEGVSVFPEDPGEAFRDKTLVAIIAHCDENVIRIPFHVGEDRSRTWILTRVTGGLQLKHDHRHADGTPDEVTMYGGTTANEGTELNQVFPADDYTGKMIPDAATNEWSLTFTADLTGLVYYLERHGKPRFRAELQRVKHTGSNQEE